MNKFLDGLAYTIFYTFALVVIAAVLGVLWAAIRTNLRETCVVMGIIIFVAALVWACIRLDRKSYE
jgi:hypothetical protein